MALNAEQRAIVNIIRNKPVELMRRFGFIDLIDLHGDWFKFMVFGQEDGMIQAHRGGYKTTVDACALALYIYLWPKKRAMFLRKTDTDVEEVIEVVSKIIKSEYYQNLCMRMYGRYADLPTDTKSKISTSLVGGVSGAPQILGAGINSSITGKHADLIMYDDIVNVKDRVSKAERQVAIRALQEFENIRNKGGRIIGTGTPWHKDDAYSMVKNVYRFDCYTTRILSDDQIQQKRDDMSASLFAANYELKHISDKDTIFKTEPKYFGSDDTLLYDSIMHVDAAYDGEDMCAMTILKAIPLTKQERLAIKATLLEGEIPPKYKYFAYGLLRVGHIDDHINEFVKAHRRFQTGTNYCEKNADKAYLAKEFRKKKVPTTSYHESANKHIKISTIGKSAWNRVQWHADTDPEYLAQILDYTDDAAHDDAPDSFSCAVRVTETSKPKASVKTYKHSL